jgi:hypothetical protein
VPGFVRLQREYRLAALLLVLNTDCDEQLTPFVSKTIKRRRDTYDVTGTTTPLDGKKYLEEWKMAGGTD